RSAATVIGGMTLGIRRATIVEFSFLLAVPTMAAATAYDLYKSANVLTLEHFELLAVGFVTSFVVALIAIGWLLRFVKTHTFEAFGVYRIAAAAVFFVVLYVVAVGRAGAMSIMSMPFLWRNTAGASAA